MDVRKAYSAEGAFCMGGVAFIALGFVGDLLQHLATIAAEPGHEHAGGDVFLRVNIPAMGIALIAFALGLYIVEHTRDRVHVLAYVAGLLILADGIAHLFAVNDHLDLPVHAAGFFVVGVVQVTGGILFPFLPRSWDRYWIALTVAMIVVFFVSRYVAVPPLWEVEELEPLGVFSKAVEILSLFPLWSLMTRGRSMPAPFGTARAAEP